jgi:GNAT superfamily N-acetyltransferase
MASIDEVIAGHVVLCGVTDRDKPNLTAACGRPAAELGEIKRLFVDPPFRRSGLAKLLLETSATAALALGLRPVLEVIAGHPGPIALYERNGWRCVATYDADWQFASGERPRAHIYDRG